jgi:hypothetical protein
LGLGDYGRLEYKAIVDHSAGNAAASKIAVRFGEGDPLVAAEIRAWRGENEAAFSRPTLEHPAEEDRPADRELGHSHSFPVCIVMELLEGETLRARHPRQSEPRLYLLVSSRGEECLWGWKFGNNHRMLLQQMDLSLDQIPAQLSSSKISLHQPVSGDIGISTISDRT